MFERQVFFFEAVDKFSADVVIAILAAGPVDGERRRIGADIHREGTRRPIPPKIFLSRPLLNPTPGRAIGMLRRNDAVARPICVGNPRAHPGDLGFQKGKETGIIGPGRTMVTSLVNQVVARLEEGMVAVARDEILLWARGQIAREEEIIAAKTDIAGDGVRIGIVSGLAPDWNIMAGIEILNLEGGIDEGDGLIRILGDHIGDSLVRRPMVNPVIAEAVHVVILIAIRVGVSPAIDQAF